MTDLLKYVRTPHLVGSRLQVGDTAEGQVAIASLTDGDQVWEEKIDGSNTGISFSDDGDLLLQSRGHYLTGGWREKQYNLLKTWAQRHIDYLFDLLGRRYIMYGEWCYAKHTVFYDLLPHYFLEFDIWDHEQQGFLATPERHDLLTGSPVVSVPVIHRDRVQTTAEVRGLIRHSLYKSTDWQTALVSRAGISDDAATRTQQIERAVQETDPSSLSEGLYLKVERNGLVTGRYKFIRPDFLQAILDSGSHWATRPILPNQLAPDIDIFT